LGAREKPKEPVRARTPYMFFVREARDFVNRNRRDIQKRDIMLEVGKLWNIVKNEGKCPGINSLDHFNRLAVKDLERFKREHAAYVNTINNLRH